ncbi:MAG: TIGR01212 family radical SAM protein [Deltaproteobacteria bacterium]|nr:MAG: TIGR01212 family radical SAM protein [Deltaproteobacteria bacterium]
MQRYLDFNQFLRKKFGERVHRIALDAGFNCPNRDGTISTQGCIFCDRRGSGTGALLDFGIDIVEQIRRSKEYIRRRYKAKRFIAYFQSFTNTYAPLNKLKELYDIALAQEDMVGFSVGTRPDCVDEKVLELLASYMDRAMVWVELGLQSAHDVTLRRINRGHDVACFERAVHMAREYGLDVCAHVILGLPGEDRDMMLQTARKVAQLPIQGIKIHLLYVVEDSPLGSLYKKGKVRCLEREEYVDLVVDFLELLPPQMVIQRLTGDPPARSNLIAPQWAKEKMPNLNLIRKRLEERNTWQGKHYEGSMSAK